MCVALGAVIAAVAGGGDGDKPERAFEPAQPAQPRPEPAPPRRPPRPRAAPKDGKGYPRGTKERFVEICSERAPLDEGQCGCVYERLHDEYEYDEFRELIGRIDAGKREVPPELLEHVLPCRIR